MFKKWFKRVKIDVFLKVFINMSLVKLLEDMQLGFWDGVWKMTRRTGSLLIRGTLIGETMVSLRYFVGKIIVALKVALLLVYLKTNIKYDKNHILFYSF